MKQLAPAAAHAPIVSGVALMPPSTCVEINQCVGCYRRGLPGSVERGTDIATPSSKRVDGVEVDATIQLLISTPPSTSMSTSKFRSTIHLRIFSILSVIVGM